MSPLLGVSESIVEKSFKLLYLPRTAISMRIKRNKLLVKSLSDKTNISTVNELLSGMKHDEVANILPISRSRVSQI